MYSINFVRQIVTRKLKDFEKMELSMVKYAHKTLKVLLNVTNALPNA